MVPWRQEQIVDPSKIYLYWSSLLIIIDHHLINNVRSLLIKSRTYIVWHYGHYWSSSSFDLLSVSYIHNIHPPLESLVLHNLTDPPFLTFLSTRYVSAFQFDSISESCSATKQINGKTITSLSLWPLTQTLVWWVGF